jgi:hypothetical protein
MGVLKKILIFLLFSNFLLAFNLQKVELRGNNIGSLERFIFKKELKRAFYKKSLRGRYKIFAKVRGYSKNFNAKSHRFRLDIDYKVYYFDKLVVNANWDLIDSISISIADKSKAKRAIIKMLFRNIANKIAKSTKESIKNKINKNFGIVTLCPNRGFDFDSAKKVYSKRGADIYYTNFMHWEDKFMMDFNIKYKKLHSVRWRYIDRFYINRYNKLISVPIIDDELHLKDTFVFKTNRLRRGKFKIIGFSDNKRCIKLKWKIFR